MGGRGQQGRRGDALLLSGGGGVAVVVVVLVVVKGGRGEKEGERRREPGDGADRGGRTGGERTTPTRGCCVARMLLSLGTRRRCGHTAG